MSANPSAPRTLAHFAFAAGLALLLGACDVTFPGSGPPPRLFALEPKTTFDTELPKVDWQLVVDPPLAPASLDTVHIALRKASVELEYYALADWTDRVPSMVQTLIIESFENTGKIVAVGRQSIELRADYALQTEIRHFEVERESGEPAPHVRIIARLIKMPAREIVDERSCDYKTAAESDTLESVVVAFNEALGRCIRRIVEWTLTTGRSPASAS